MLMGINKLLPLRVCHPEIRQQLSAPGSRADISPPAMPSKSVAQASHAHTICREAISTRWGCSCANPALHNSQRSAGAPGAGELAKRSEGLIEGGGVPVAGMIMRSLGPDDTVQSQSAPSTSA